MAKKSNNAFGKIFDKVEIPALVATVIALITVIVIYFVFCLELALVVLAGMILIVGMSALLKKLKKKRKLRILLNVLLILFFLIAIAVLIALAGFCIYIVKESPEFDINKLTKREASIVYDKDGNEFGRFGSELRENISYDDLPEVFIDALIATEDSRFFQHNGFDAPRFFKASLGQALGNSDAGGASTLTMQLSKNTFTDGMNRTRGFDGVVRKFEDIYISVFKLEKNFTKEEIIEYYVNNYDLGNNSYGVEQASQTIFGKSVTELNLAESATLVGIFNNPTKYNPILHPQASESRRNTVLNLMVNHGYITREEADMAKKIPVSSLINPKKVNRQYQAYLDTVWEELDTKYGLNPNTTSLLIYTNMDPVRQKGLDDIFNGESNLYRWVNDKVQGAAAVVETHSGKLVAVGQGRNRDQALMPTRATSPKWGHHIGSSAKPIFDYAPAIEYLNWSTYQQIVDEPWSYSNGQKITNSDDKYLGQISMRYAIEQSRNIPALKAFQAVVNEVGNDKLYEFVTNLGIKPGESNGIIYEACSIGAFDGTTALQMAGAYAAFGNGGIYYEPYTINRIVYRENNDVKNIKVEGKRAMSEATAFMVTDMLVTAVTNGISSGAKVNGVVVAAKTGTSNYTPQVKRQYNLASDAVKDSWIVGFDPEYSLAMWYGYDKATDGYNRKVAAINERGKLYRALGTVVFNKTNKGFTMPNSVDRICVEKGTNPPSLPSSGTPADQITCEYFKKGTEPTEVSTAYQKLDSPSNLKVTYDEKSGIIKITWSRIETPNGSDGYGSFGYNVYYGDVLLGFTTESTYSLKAGTNISGTYKVVSTFENYTNNQSLPATYNFVYVAPTPSPTPTPTPKPTPTPVPTDDPGEEVIQLP